MKKQEKVMNYEQEARKRKKKKYLGNVRCGNPGDLT